jgi:predicted TIM-barrel fold metal-dependent hydrolase
MRRRNFLTGTAATALPIAAEAAPPADIPIIDPHVHLFDATRPQGVPYAGSKFYKGGISTPAMYDKLARPAGIVGAMAMEASPWIEDNLWLMERVESDPMFVGMIGMLQPDKPEFAEYLDRYRKNKLFRGIRFGKLWGFNISTKVNDPAFIAGLKRLAAADLSLDTANPDIDLLQTMVRLNDKVPGLRMVIDHLPQLDPAPDAQGAYAAVLKEMEKRPHIYAKISEIDHFVKGKLVSGLAAHKDRLDLLTGTFGEDRVIFNTNYPQSVGEATIPQIVALTKSYYAGKPHAAAEKFFWKNSRAVYKWVKRGADQPG